MSNPSPVGADLSVRGERRNGIVRLFVGGELDVSTGPMLQREIDAATDLGGALIIDLRDLSFMDDVGLYTLERAARAASRDDWRLCIVNCFGPVRDEFDEAGSDLLLASIAVSDLLDAGDQPWTPIPLPSLLGRRSHRYARSARRPS